MWSFPGLPAAVNLLGSQLPFNIVPSPSHPICNSASVDHPTLFGARILSLTATPVVNYSTPIEGDDSLPIKEANNISFCNVTVTYTHPGANDEVNVMVWLPLEADSWNGRFLGTGGGGFVTGLSFIYLPMAIVRGFAAASTDGGHSRDEAFPIADWAMLSPGNLDWHLLQNFASRGLNDMSIIGKAVTESYYARTIDYSYWYGCSTGGRQGLMQAQRFPDNYDGIVALAPAINFADFSIAAYWPQLVMDREGIYPTPCEIEAVTAATIEACDEIDGIRDGIVSAPGLCTFDPHSAVGKSYDCNGVPTVITKDAATIAIETWTGPRSLTGKSLWPGLAKGTSLAVLAATRCTADGKCISHPFFPNSDWMTVFLEKDADYDLGSITYQKFEDMMHASSHEFDSILGTRDPDLSAFRRRGGKMITWHGIADEKITPNGTSDYYRRVLELDPNAGDFYRYFEAPGVHHCGAGPGPTPDDTLGELMAWVEGGKAPEELLASQVDPMDGTKIPRNVCRWPRTSVFQDGKFICK